MGPTTPDGKQASRLNALTHGLRAKEVIIPGQEDPAELELILKELCADWEPDGHTETHLVEQIGLAEWRLRRVRRAELGEIRRQMASSTASDVEDQIEEAKLDPKSLSVTLPKILGKSTAGIAYKRKEVQAALDELESDDIVSARTISSLEIMFGKETDSPANMFRIWFKRDAPDEKVAARIKETAREQLELTLKKLRKQERTDLEIAGQRMSIPQGPELERIQRYETAIKRNMYRDIEQLERLQRRRRGEPPPPTVNLNVSKDD
jgi:hypothetical protein